MKKYIAAGIIYFLVWSKIAISATVKGVVTDQATAEPIIGATVYIPLLNIGNASGLDGSFTIKNVPIGSYKMSISYMGYISQQIDISVDDQNTTLLVNILLNEETNQLTEVVVTGTEDKSTDESVNRSVRESARVVNMVSARSIQISPDVTVSNVIQRVSGVSVERNDNGDGQHAIVRGMDKRYNYTLVNGVKIPSPDNKYRYVPLDIFPAELLDRLEVTKSLTPDMEGDAVGGVINMVMKNAPAQKYISANAATGYSELFLNRDFMFFNRNDINRLSPYEVYGRNYNATMADFPKGMVDYQPGKPLPNLFAGLALGSRYVKNKLGVMVAGSYQNTYRGSNSLFFDTQNTDTNRFATIVDIDERQFSEQQIRYGLHSKIDFTITPKHKFSFYNAYMRLTNIQTRDTKRTYLTAGYEPDQGNAKLGYELRSRVTIQQIYNGTVQGEHQIHPNFKADWSAVYSIATNEIPDNTQVEVRGERINNVERKTTPDTGRRRWERNNDTDLAAYGNLAYSQKGGIVPVEIKAGGLFRAKKRDNFYNNYTLQPIPNRVNDEFGRDFQNFTDIPWELQNPRGSVATALYYNATEYISAYYAQAKTKIIKTEILTGVRVENTNQGYSLQFPAGEPFPTGSQVYSSILPSVHIKQGVIENHYLKSSYFRSINRPGFFEIVPYRIVNEDFVERGNRDLKHAVADNIDLRYEVFPSRTEQYMIGVFYKNIQNPIEYTLQPDARRGQDIYYSPGNFGTAVNYGMEADMIKYIRVFGFKLNYTYTNSSITTAKSIRFRDANGDLVTSSTTQTRPLYGQSKHIWNLTLLYKNSNKGVDAQIAFAYTGERINTVSQFVDNDIWQKPFTQVDASAEKTFRKHWIVFLKANNLFDTPQILFIKGTNEANLDLPYQNLLKGETLVRRDLYQRSYMVGVRYKL